MVWWVTISIIQSHDNHVITIILFCVLYNEPASHLWLLHTHTHHTMVFLFQNVISMVFFDLHGHCLWTLNSVPERERSGSCDPQMIKIRHTLLKTPRPKYSATTLNPSGDLCSCVGYKVHHRGNLRPHPPVIPESGTARAAQRSALVSGLCPTLS